MQNSASSNGTLLSLGVSQRPANDLKEYYLLLNGQQYPSQAVNNISKMFYETKRAWDQTDNISAGILSLSNYTARNAADQATQLADDVYTTIVRKRFLGSIDLDRFNHSGETLMSGSNTIGQSLNLNLLFNSPILNDTQLYAFIMYDVNYRLEDGLLTAHF
jgi:phytoene dehydrogenase-like protein